MTYPDEIITMLLDIVGDRHRGNVCSVSKQWLRCALRFLPKDLDLRELRKNILFAGTSVTFPWGQLHRGVVELPEYDDIIKIHANKHLLTRLYRARDCTDGSCSDYLCACMFSMPDGYGLYDNLVKK